MNIKKLVLHGSILKKVALLLIIAVVLYAGVLIGRSTAPPPTEVARTNSVVLDAVEPITVWTCSMHPQIRLPEPGQCPICGMDLIPLVDDAGDLSAAPRLVMSAADQKLAEIQTTAVKRQFVDAHVRMVGKIDYDETLVKTISSYVPGRIDRLYVNYTGVPVQKGEHLALIYSPELLVAQQELLEAKKRLSTLSGEKSEFLRQSDQRALESSREKLRLFGFSNEQIEAIEERGTAEDNMMISAPLGGIVIHKGVNEGQYVETGTPIYTVADLGRIWVKLDAYESDLVWLHYGQHVDIEAEALPGEHFDGIISFIDPVLDPTTRTVKVRVNVENPGGRLKPGMFVRGIVRAGVAKGGKVMDPALAGKWISPMHPEIVRDAPGDCPVCGMDLVKAEDLGYVSSDDETAKPLVVPASAVLRTGRRAVVYVELPNTDRPTYEGREVVLGPRAGDHYIVQQGLREGERVVTNGNFNIDSALQIQAKPSMLSMPGESADGEGDVTAFRKLLQPLYDAYFNVQAHLARDELLPAQNGAKPVPNLLHDIEPTLLEGDTQETWITAAEQIAAAIDELVEAPELPEARRAFQAWSDAMLRVERRLGHAEATSYYEIFCPMAFGTGASWLQTGAEIRNPYYGAEMLDCGKVTTVHEPEMVHAPAAAAGGHEHQH